MRGLPFVARLYVTAVVAAGGAVFLACLPQVAWDHPITLATLFLVALGTAALKVYLPLPGGGSTMSVSYAADFASLLLLGPHATMLLAVCAVFCQCTLFTSRKNPAHRTLFSMASIVITVHAAAFILRLSGGRLDAPLSLVAPLVATATVYFVFNTGLVATAISLASCENILKVWEDNFLWSAPSYFISAALALMALSLIKFGGLWLAPLTLLPLYLTYCSYKIFLGRIHTEQQQVKATAALHLATVEALARAIDAKDQPAYNHIWRVQLYATRLAEALGLAEPAIQAVKTAALLHDIGKLAVPEHILSKPGPLTQEEFEKIQIHPQMGANIIAGVPFPYPVAPLILSHHERWDGTGYPNALKEEAIPLGARILSIVDYFDAVTTERPYHKALSCAEAVALIKREAGHALDPRLVETFLDMLPSLVAESIASELKPPTLAPMRISPAGTTASGLVPDTTPESVFENIALAHREVYALYDIAQAMTASLGISDTMALISAKLTKIVPWSGCSLFLCDQETGALRCVFAVGLDAPALLNRTLSSEGALEGWVARKRRSLVNSDPRVTFEAARVGSTTELKSAMVCPLAFEGKLIGVLSLYHVDANRYTEDHRRLLDRIAEQAAPVLRNSILFEQTQEDALTDPLTGLPNRRSLSVHLTREMARADRLGATVAVIVVDVDDFKQINDTYGHHVGDQALREMAQALRPLLRPYDLCVRYAGDEFILMIPGCNEEAGQARCKELQERVAAIQLEVEAGRKVGIGASAGMALFPVDGRTFEEILAQADRRMYKDKSARRQGMTTRTAGSDGSPKEFDSTAPRSAPLAESPYVH